DELCGAKRYERSMERLDRRAGHYERKLQTKAGEVALQVPRLRSLPFETQIIERYRRRESSVEEALMEMYLAGVSVPWRTWRFWWRSPWAATGIAKFWAFARGRRKTKRVGGASCGT